MEATTLISTSSSLPSVSSSSSHTNDEVIVLTSSSSSDIPELNCRDDTGKGSITPTTMSNSVSPTVITTTVTKAIINPVVVVASSKIAEPIVCSDDDGIESISSTAETSTTQLPSPTVTTITALTIIGTEETVTPTETVIDQEVIVSSSEIPTELDCWDVERVSILTTTSVTAVAATTIPSTTVATEMAATDQVVVVASSDQITEPIESFHDDPNDGTTILLNNANLSHYPKLILLSSLTILRCVLGLTVLVAFCSLLPIAYVASYFHYRVYSTTEDQVIKGVQGDDDKPLGNVEIKLTSVRRSLIQAKTSVYFSRSLKSCLMKNPTISSFELNLKERTLSNYSQTYSMKALTKSIMSESDIIEAVEWANTNGSCIRAMGSLFSWPEIARPGSSEEGDNLVDGVVLDMKEYNQMVRRALNVEPESDGTVAFVTVQAGMKVWQLCDLLDRLGYALPVLGNVTGESVGGIISTGTHGKNPRFGTLSSIVQSMRVILGSGKLKNISMRTSSGKFSSDPLAQAAGVSMGLLGIISTVTFRVVPKHRLAFSIQVVSFDKFLESYDTLLQENEHVAAVFFPFTDHFRLELSRKLSPKEILLPNKPMPAHNRTKIFFTKILNWLLFESVFHLWFSSLVWAIQRFVVVGDMQYQAPIHSPAVDTSYKVIANNVGLDIENQKMEFAYDKSDTKAILRAYRDTFRSLPITHQLSGRLDVRFSDSDSAWLAGSYARSSVWLNLVRPNVHRDSHEFMMSFKPIIKKFYGRPHFGKECVLSPKDIASVFPNFDNFIKIRNKCDPKKVFSNPHLDRIFVKQMDQVSDIQQKGLFQVTGARRRTSNNHWLIEYQHRSNKSIRENASNNV